MNKNSTKTKDRYCLPDKLWQLLRKQLPQVAKEKKRGRPRAEDRRVLDGIWYVLWTGCQWKSIQKEWFGVSSSVLHERFQTWQSQGLFEKLFRTMLKYYARECGIGWKWQAVDSMMSASPLGGSKTGKNPTDRGKLGSKIHLLVDQRGAPLAIWVTGANEHDKWSLDDLVIHIAARRPDSKQHLCADKGYDFEDVHEFVAQQGYVAHIKHRRKRNELEEKPRPTGKKHFPARRWVVERTFGWLAKRRSIATRWCKKAQNWLAFIFMACAEIVLALISG